MTAILTQRVLAGISVDAQGQPLTVWEGDYDFADDYERGAYEAWRGKSRGFRGVSAEYKEGRAAQMELLPKDHNGRVRWGLYKIGCGWCLKDAYTTKGAHFFGE